MWIADKIYYQNSSNFIRAYQGTELVWEINMFRFTAKANNSSIGLASLSTGHTIEYSTNNTSWTNMTTATTISLGSGDTVYVRGVLSSNQTSINCTQFKMSGDIKASGNINYLWDKNNLEAPLKDYCGYYLFDRCSGLTDASELELPSNTLALCCYYNMFSRCTSLTATPSLPATTLAPYCYGYMFMGCTSLTTAPVLPATTLANNCYYYMFGSCTSLTTAPELPATTLADACYSYMFNYCTNLTTAPSLPITTLVTGCYGAMFRGCTSLTTTPSLPATTLANSCYGSMFSGCTSIVTPPTLPATTLADNCYRGMFAGCTSLNTTPSLPVTTLAEGCYREMFSGCTSIVTPPTLTATTLEDYCYYGMFINCTSLTTTPELPATTLAANCYRNMFQNCISLTTAPDLPATTLATYCYFGMFRGCTNITTAPQLSATTLADYCYQYMFQGCTSLTTAPQLPATTLANECYSGMFHNCSGLTTAPELPATTLATRCYDAMFKNCTSLQTPPELPATTLATRCYREMFYGCTSLTTAPQLPATTLAQYCYSYMFKGCTSLNYIQCLATDTSVTDCTYDWVNGVGNSGTFVKDSSMTWYYGNSGVPIGWTIYDYSPIDFTKKHWWTPTSGSYNFNLSTRWNNGYRVEVDKYFTGGGNTSSCGSIFRQNSNNSPFEVFYTSAFYFDAHYPNSTTSPTVNTSDYDHRLSLIRSRFNSEVKPNVKYTFKYEITPTHAIRIYSGETLVYQTTYSSGDKNWCTTEDYSLNAASMAARSGWCVISDIRVYDNSNTLIHNFQLYPNPNSYNEYQYYDRITETWYPVVNGEISKVETTER